MERAFLSTVGIVAVLGLWQGLSSAGKLKPLIWSSPALIWQSFRAMVSDGSLGTLCVQSGKLFIVGFAVSVVTGLLAGAVLGWYAKARAVIDPWISMLYALPAVALIPLLIVAFGSDFRTQVIVVWTVAVFPMLINVAAGVGTVDRKHLELARSFLATNRDVLRDIALPGSVPYIMSGIQQTLSLSLIGVVVAEYFVGNDGLGGLILNASSELRTADAYVGTIIFALAGLLFTALLRRAERWAIRWR